MTPSPKTLCVYCSSSNAVAPAYFAVAEEMGALMAQRQITLIYGGGNIGLMGAIARSTHAHGGRVVGVIPHFMRKREVAYEAADELIVTKDMRERKAIMESRADAFVAMPGGFGTLEEVLEILTLKQLRTHHKPVVLLNTEGFFDHLLQMFEKLYEERFTKADYRHFYHVAARPSDVFTHLDGYQPPPMGEHKWF
jgi:uncharacterized protein (TIGR00730 family)